MSVSYSYDALNRLSTTTDDGKDTRPATGSTSYSYDAVGNLSGYLYPNGVQSSYNYNSLNRLTSMSLSKAATTMASYAYTLGAAGNRLSVVEANGRRVNYSYDDLYRLTSETITTDPVTANNGSISYSYDPVGNRLSRNSSIAAVPSMTSSLDANDRLTSDVYDANGNTKESSGNSYTYDFENRLTSLNNGQVQIVYDGDGNRVSKTVGGVTTRYLVDMNNLTGYAQVVEEIASGSVQRVYVYGNDLISQQQIVSGNWSTSFFGYDGHGSVRMLTDASGAVTDTYTYDAFGILIHQTGSTANDYLYAGEQRDSHLGLDYLRARYLNPATGRFWSMDSFEGIGSDPHTLHKYLYVGNNSVNKVDPSGKVEITIAGFTFNISIRGILQSMAIGAVAGAIIGGTDAYLRGASADEILEEAIQAGLIGGLLGPLARVKFLGAALVAFGEATAIYGVIDAIEQGNAPLAIFRSVLAIVGAATFVQPELASPGYSRLPPAPNPGGRLGSNTTRGQILEIARILEERGWEITGGGRLPEEYLPPMSGSGTKGSNFADMTATKNGRTLRINTVDTISDGVTPTRREAAAAALIRAKKPEDHLLLIPKLK